MSDLLRRYGNGTFFLSCAICGSGDWSTISRLHEQEWRQLVTCSRTYLVCPSCGRKQTSPPLRPLMDPVA